MRFDPDMFGLEAAAGLTDDTWDNQKFKLGMSAFTGSLLVGANIPVFQPYIGLGFNSTKFEAGLKGNFPVIEADLTQAIISGYEADPLTSTSKETNFAFIIRHKFRYTYRISRIDINLREIIDSRACMVRMHMRGDQRNRLIRDGSH